MSTIVQDLRFALRTLFRRNPALTLVATVTLGLGIGANTAIFSVVRGVLLDPLPYPEPDRLVRLYGGWEKNPNAREFMTAPAVLDARDLDQVFESVACAYTYGDLGFDLTAAGAAPLRVASLRVSSDFFELLGFRAALGRTFTRADENTETRRVLLSNHLWRERFGGDRAIVGRSILLDGEAWVVRGVLPADFRSPVGRPVDLWVPQNLRLGDYNHRGNHYLTTLARLRTGVSFEQAQAALQRLNERTAAEFPRIADEFIYARPLHDDLTGDSQPLLYALLGAVGLVLLIACVNVANLLLVQGAARRKEMAVRAALGSGRTRLVRQLLTENLVLAVLGGAAGLIFAGAGVRILLSLRPAGLPRIGDIGVDQRLLMITAGLTLMTGLVSGLVPALQGGRVSLERTLREESKGSSGSPWSRRFRQTLVVLQVALALVLLTGAGLLMKSFVRLSALDLGFSPESVLSYQVHLPAIRYTEPDARARFHQRLHENLHALPGVVAAGAVSKLPISGRYHQWGFRAEGSAEDDWHSADIRVVAGEYFAALRIPLRQGRLLGDGDHADTPPAMLVNQTLARQLWPDADPIGKRILLSDTSWQIVGVVAATRHHHRQAPAAQIYLPHSQFAADRNWALTQVIRTATADPGVIALARQELTSLDPNLILHAARPLDSLVAEGVAEQRFTLLLMGAFAAVALCLAAVGLYGVLSFSVEERTREIGIRLALGAGQGQIRSLVTAQCLALVATGVVLGLGGAFAVTRWLATLVFDVSVTDPSTFAGVAVVLSAVAAVAAMIPMRRATRVDPLTVLRYE